MPLLFLFSLVTLTQFFAPADAAPGQYFVGLTLKNYCEAKQFCRSKGGELATVRNAQDNKAAATACASNRNQNQNQNQHRHSEEATSIAHSPCWLGLTEFVGTGLTPTEAQLWIWSDGNSSTEPKGTLYDQKRTYTYGYYDELPHTTAFNATDNTTMLLTNAKTQQQSGGGVPLSSYNYQNWAGCEDYEEHEDKHGHQDENDKKLRCDWSEPNNYMGCSESHAFMGNGRDEIYQEYDFLPGKWYDVSAHDYVEFIPLCEYVTHAEPIHDHECDKTLAYCWYEQCENEQVGKDGSSCWAEKNGTAPKCSMNAVPKYTDLEMTYTTTQNGKDTSTSYREYTCCDDQDNSGRTKHGYCYGDFDHDQDWSWLFGLFVLFCCCAFGGIAVCVCYCLCRNKQHASHVVHQQQQHVPRGSVQMVNMGQLQTTPQIVQVTVPANGVVGSTMMVQLPNGTSMQVTVPMGAGPGSVLTVHSDAMGGGGGGGALVQPPNRNVPALPTEDWNDKSERLPIRVIPLMSGGGGGGGGGRGGVGRAPIVISEPIVVPRQQLQQQQQQQQPVEVLRPVV